jgi:hypothetical protein
MSATCGKMRLGHRLRSATAESAAFQAEPTNLTDTFVSKVPSNLLQIGAISLNSSMQITELCELESFAVSLTEQKVYFSIAAQLRAGFVIHIELLDEFVTFDLKHSMSGNFYPVH